MSAEMIDTTQAAEILGVKPGTLRTWRCKGFGPRYIQYSNTATRRYRRADVEAFIDGSIVTPDSYESTTSTTSTGYENDPCPFQDLAE